MNHPPLHIHSHSAAFLEHDAFDASVTGAGVSSMGHDAYCHDKVLQLKSKIKKRRAGTFCCVASIASLLISVVLIATALTSHLRSDFDLYNRSVVTSCTLQSVENEQVDGSWSSDCVFTFSSSVCDVVVETALCSYHSDGDNGRSRDCAVDGSEDGATSGTCEGTAVGFARLQREHNMFIFILVFGAVFGVVCVATAIYALCATNDVGLYHSARSVRMDSEQMANALQELHSSDASSHTCAPASITTQQPQRGSIEISDLEADADTV